MVTTNDQAWIDSLERAARTLRAAAASFRSQGGEIDDLLRIVGDGIAEADGWHITANSLATMRAIGYEPSGADVNAPAPRRAA